MTLRHKTRLNTSGQGFKKDPILSSNGWMDDLRFYVLFNSVSVISGRC